MSSSAGGSAAAAGWRLRSAIVIAGVGADEPEQERRNRSAWYEPTGTAIVTSCFHDRAAPVTSSSRPAGVGRTPAQRTGRVRATGTPATR